MVAAPDRETQVVAYQTANIPAFILHYQRWGIATCVGFVFATHSKQVVFVVKMYFAVRHYPQQAVVIIVVLYGLEERRINSSKYFVIN